MSTDIVLNAQEYGIEESRAQQLEKVFIPMVNKFKELENEFQEINNTEITRNVCQQAANLRNKYVKIRTGTDKLHKEQKASLLVQTRALDGLRNIVKYAVLENEEKLKNIEKHFEILEAKRKKELQEKRENIVAKYDVNGSTLDLASMTDEVWDNFLAGTKANYDAKMEAERVAEEQRKAKEKAEAEERELIKKENERLKIEAKRVAEEQRKAKEKARKEREEYEAKLKAEREERERLAAIEAKRVAEEQRKAKEKAEAEKLEAEAPDREKLLIFAERLKNANLPNVKTKKGKEILNYIHNTFQDLHIYITNQFKINERKAA